VDDPGAENSHSVQSSDVQLRDLTSIKCSSRRSSCYPFRCLSETHIIHSV